MARKSMSAIRAMSEKDLRSRLQEARSDLVKIRGEAGRGTIKKESGNIRPMRRDVARMMTRLSEIRLERAGRARRRDGTRGRAAEEAGSGGGAK